jgi:hypothetical protein
VYLADNSVLWDFRNSSREPDYNCCPEFGTDSTNVATPSFNRGRIGRLSHPCDLCCRWTDNGKTQSRAVGARMTDNEQAQIPDKWLYRIVVLALAIVALFVVGGGVVLYGLSRATLPTVVWSIGSAAVGGLAGLLAPSPIKR